MMDVAERLRGEFDLEILALDGGAPERLLGEELAARFGAWTPIRKRWELRPRFRAADAVLWYGVVNAVPDVLAALAAMDERPASVRVVHTSREEDGPAFQRRWGRVIDATVCVSPTIARTIPGAVFIPNTCSGETLKGPRLEAFPPGRPTLGWLGRLVPLKNVPWLIENAEAIGCNLLVQALDTPLLSVAELQRRAGSNVKFLPPSRDVGTLLRSVDALILVSDHEGFPRVVIEAGMVGTPVIATPVGALPELFGEEILFVDGPPDAASVRAALERLDPSSGPRLQEKVVRLCFLETVAARYAGVIHGALARAAA
jgi:glycosyltransferase involved in cell wall biosynthesis